MIASQIFFFFLMLFRLNCHFSDEHIAIIIEIMIDNIGVCMGKHHLIMVAADKNF
jgi:hypothetical protein